MSASQLRHFAIGIVVVAGLGALLIGGDEPAPPAATPAIAGKTTPAQRLAAPGPGLAPAMADAGESGEFDLGGNPDNPDEIPGVAPAPAQLARTEADTLPPIGLSQMPGGVMRRTRTIPNQPTPR